MGHNLGGSVVSQARGMNQIDNIIQSVTVESVRRIYTKYTNFKQMYVLTNTN